MKLDAENGDDRDSKEVEQIIESSQHAINSSTVPKSEKRINGS